MNITTYNKLGKPISNEKYNVAVFNQNMDIIDSALNRSVLKDTAVETKLNEHINDINNPHKVTKSQIGLGNVNNTADAVKNVLSAAKLSVNRAISLNGEVVGSVLTDFNNDVNITTTVTELDASKITSGIFDIDRIPKAAIPDIKLVKDDSSRFALTKEEIQKGDTVKVTDTGLMYYVKDDTKLSSDDGYEPYTADIASKVPWSGITGKPITFTPSTHTHTKSQITDFPVALPNPNSMTLQFNGTAQTPYTGASALTLNITPGAIGAAAASHGTHVSFSTDAPKVAGTATVGISSTVSRSDHIHPLQTSVSGNSGSATKLSTAQSIDGVSFNGTANITHYGSCATATATVEKAVPCTGFVLSVGSRIIVKFTNTNTAASPTLNVNGTGAKSICYRGVAIGAGYLSANRTYEFVYNGTQYELIGDINTDTAATLATARTIALGGGVTGTATSFNGGANITIPVTSINTDYLINGSNTLIFNCGGAD